MSGKSADVHRVVLPAGGSAGSTGAGSRPSALRVSTRWIVRSAVAETRDDRAGHRLELDLTEVTAEDVGDVDVQLAARIVLPILPPARDAGEVVPGVGVTSPDQVVRHDVPADVPRLLKRTVGRWGGPFVRLPVTRVAESWDPPTDSEQAVVQAVPEGGVHVGVAAGGPDVDAEEIHGELGRVAPSDSTKGSQRYDAGRVALSPWERPYNCQLPWSRSAASHDACERLDIPPLDAAALALDAAFAHPPVDPDEFADMLLTMAGDLHSHGCLGQVIEVDVVRPTIRTPTDRPRWPPSVGGMSMEAAKFRRRRRHSLAAKRTQRDSPPGLAPVPGSRELGRSWAAARRKASSSAAWRSSFDRCCPMCVPLERTTCVPIREPLELLPRLTASFPKRLDRRGSAGAE